MSWLLAFVGFAALIVLHELGHFLAAKAVGMRVERFSLFFGPLVLKRRWGETEYGVGVIPLGGYVRITGMDPREELPADVAPRAYYRQAPWRRIVVIAAGPTMNVLIAFVLLFAIYLGHGKAVATNTVEQIERGSPAAQVLRLGDRVLAVDGVRDGPETLRAQLARHTCPGGSRKDGCEAARPAVLTVQRDGRELVVRARPRWSAQDGRPLLGFAFGARLAGVSAGRAASLSVSRMWILGRDTVGAVVRIFYSSKARKEVSGVVGSYEVARESFEFDTVQAIFVIAVISLSLAIINLFPFVPLDGGHIFWALAEKVRGRPIPFEVIERAGALGFVLIILLFAVGLTNDIGRLRGEGFGLR
jgi:regulator of sigma E protease